MMRIDTARPAHQLGLFHGMPKPKGPCGFILNQNECPFPDTCGYSHDKEVIDRWQPKKCKYGTGCPHYQKGCCVMYHPPGGGKTKRHAQMLAGLADEVKIAVSEDRTSPLERVVIRNEEHIAGFNILKDGKIAVPGMPAAFTRPKMVMFCKKADVACKYVKEANFRENDWPKFHPLTASIRTLRPDLEISDFHIVTSTGCLRRIFKFLNKSEYRTERLDLEYKDGALFVGRWSEDPCINTHLGFGMQFERNTRSFAGVEELKDSVSHHRVTRFEMGGLKIVMQAELDATFCECHGLGAMAALGDVKKTSPEPKPRLAHKPRSLSGRFDALSLDDPGDMGNSAATATSLPEIPGIIRAGTMVPSACCLEIKTRAKSAPKWNDFRPQLYFQRTTRVFEALHEKNRFVLRDMCIHEMTDEMQRWEETNQPILAKLVKLLEDVRRKARERFQRQGEGRGCKMALVLGSCDGREDEGDWRATLFMKREGETIIPDEL